MNWKMSSSCHCRDVLEGDVFALVSRLCETFSRSPSSLCLSQEQNRRLKHKKWTRLRRTAFEHILFDYPAEFDRNETLEALNSVSQPLKSHDNTKPSAQFADRIQNIISEVGDGDNADTVLRGLAFLLPLRVSKPAVMRSIIGYGAIDASSTLDSRALDEQTLFSSVPHLAPQDLPRYDYYSSSVFTSSSCSVADSVFSANSCADSIPQLALYPPISSVALTCLPGTSVSLSTLYQHEDEGIYELDMRRRLYGALTHPYSADHLLGILELPQLDSKPAELVPNLAQRIQKSSSDEGFRDGSVGADNSQPQTFTLPRSSGLTSGVGDTVQTLRDPSLHETFPLSWEVQRRPGGIVALNLIEKPYLTEACSTVFDQVYRLHLQCLVNITGTIYYPTLFVIGLADLMRDCSKLLLGLPSKCFTFSDGSQSFSVRHGLVVAGLSCESLESVCQELIDAGTFYYRLHKLGHQPAEGLVINAFFKTIRSYLHTYTACILELTRNARSPLHLQTILRRTLWQLRYIAELCMCSDLAMPCYPADGFPQGMKLLAYIYQKTLDTDCQAALPLMLHVLHYSCQPYLIFLRDWVFHGDCNDPYEEFIVRVDPAHLHQRDRRYWSLGYKLLPDLEHGSLFLGNSADQMFKCGKSINLLKQVAPEHPICSMVNETPNINIHYSQSEFTMAERYCDVYVSRVREMVKHRLSQRQKILDLKEQARRAVLIAAQAEHTKRLDEMQRLVRDRQLHRSSQKRVLFAEQKAIIEEAQKRKTEDAKAEKKRDVDMVEALSKREQLQTVADQKLMQQARDELIEYYRLMSEAAATREQKALWKVRRMQLNGLRDTWMSEYQLRLRDALSSIEMLQPSTDVWKADEPAVQAKPVSTRPRWQLPSSLDIKEEKDVIDIPEEKDVIDIPGEQPGLSAKQSEGLMKQSDTLAVLSDVLVEQPAASVLGHEEQLEGQFVSDIEKVAPSISISDVVLEDPVVPDTFYFPSICITDPRQTTRETVQGEHRSCVRMSSVQSACAESSEEVALPKSRSAVYLAALRTSVPDELAIRPRSTWGHPSDTSSPTRDSFIHRVKKVDGRHSSVTTLDRDFLIKPIKRKDPNSVSEQKMSKPITRSHPTYNATAESVVDTDTLQEKRYEILRSQVSRKHLNEESQQTDAGALRLSKFRAINKQGRHATDSTIQKIMYIDKDKLSDSFPVDSFASREPVQCASAEDGSRDYNEMFDTLFASTSLQLGVPEDWRRRDDTLSLDDEIPLYEHMVVPCVLQNSILHTLRAQIQLANESILSHFKVDLEIGKHFEILQQHLLMARGEFAQAFVTSVFEKLHRSENHHSVMSYVFLNDALARALQSAPSRDQPFLNSLSLLINKPPAHLATHSLQALGWLRLTYKVVWPINIIITADHLEKYAEIFSFLMRIKHISYLLGDIWLSLKRADTIHETQHSEQFRILQLYRHDMQHFAKVMHAYIAIQLTQVAWQGFQKTFAEVTDLDQLYDCHERFLNGCLAKCFLSRQLQPIVRIIEGILKSVLNFHALLSAGMWTTDETGKLIHSEFENICKTYTPYLEYTRFLNKVLSRMTIGEKHPHLKELQLMLNFNSYYGE